MIMTTIIFVVSVVAAYVIVEGFFVSLRDKEQGDKRR